MGRRRGSQPRPAAAKATTGWEIPAWGAPLLLPLALLVTARVHGSALGTYFAQDDITFLYRARGLAPTAWSLARPLSEIVTWRALNALFGLHPLPYHLFNLALHLGNVALVYAIARRLAGGRGAAFAAALLFGASAIEIGRASCRERV